MIKFFSSVRWRMPMTVLALLAAATVAAASNKALSVPGLLSGPQVITDGKMSEPQWQKAAVIEDFYLFNSQKLSSSKISARIWHDGKMLYIGTRVPYPTQTKLKPWTAKIEVLTANTAEPRFFNSYIWYGGKGRNATLRESRWSSANTFANGEWSSEAAIPLSELKLHSGGIRFNIHITPPGSKTAVIWENCGRKLYNIERFGELLLIDYNSAAMARKGIYRQPELDRAGYQNLPDKTEYELECGPWLHAPDTGKISIGFVSRTACAAEVLYRVKDSKKWLTQTGDLFFGAASRSRINHNVHLSGLSAGKSYEYQIRLTFPDGSVKTFAPDKGKSWHFTLPAANKSDITFAVFSDIHNFRARLDNLMAHTRGCEFLVNLGDMVNIANSPSLFLDGYLKGELRYAAEHPLVNLRGNHEFRGLAPELYFEYFGTPDNKPYFISRWGSLCLIGLDAGEDGRDKNSMAMLPAQREWLKQAIKTPEFQNAKWRIVLIHIPPMKPGTTSTRRVMTLIENIFTGPQAEKIHLMLAGHTHIASLTPANSDECHRYEPKPNRIPTLKLPFPVICNSGMGNTMLKVELKNNTLNVVHLRPDGTEMARFQGSL